MIDTKQVIEGLRTSPLDGPNHLLDRVIISSLCVEVERLAKICEQSQFGGRPDCPECFTASTNYDPAIRDWACGPCDNGGGSD